MIKRLCRCSKARADYQLLDEKALAKTIRQLEKEMQEHARNLEFEKAAAATRDRLFRLRQQAFGAEGHDSSAASPNAAQAERDLINVVLALVRSARRLLKLPVGGEYRMKILFVCTGNICRSPTAEGVARRWLADGGAGCVWWGSILRGRRGITPASRPIRARSRRPCGAATTFPA